MACPAKGFDPARKLGFRQLCHSNGNPNHQSETSELSSLDLAAQGQYNPPISFKKWVRLRNHALWASKALVEVRRLQNLVKPKTLLSRAFWRREVLKQCIHGSSQRCTVKKTSNIREIKHGPRVPNTLPASWNRGSPCLGSRSARLQQLYIWVGEQCENPATPAVK